MKFSDYIIYVDESGDHSLTKIDKGYPVFVLAFCIFRKQDYIENVVPAVQQLKFDYWGHDNIVLHEREMRQKKPPFGFLFDQAIRDEFMSRLNNIIRQADFKIIHGFVEKSGDTARQAEAAGFGVYHLALNLCLLQTAVFLKSLGQEELITDVICESRGKKEDAELLREFEHLCAERPELAEIYRNLRVSIASKQCNSTGLQIADMVARPLGLSRISPNQPNRAMDIIRPKIWPENPFQMLSIMSSLQQAVQKI